LRRKEKKREGKEIMTNQQIRKEKEKEKIYLEEKLIVCKCKSIQISSQEHNKMI